MNTGMLWFDNDPKRALAEKISEAAAYYLKKYKVTADMCMVNPKAVVEPMVEVPGITVRPMRAMMPGYLWIGAEGA